MVEQPGRLGVRRATGLQLLELRGDGGGTPLECRGAGCGVDWSGPRHGLHLGVGGAGDGGGGADAAGVEADDVVGALHAGEGRRRHDANAVHPGPTGAAGVHEEGALARRAGGQVLLHRDLNGLPIRLGVVQRHCDLGALKTGLVSRLLHSCRGHAVVPLDLLTVEGLQPLGNRRLRRSRSRPRSRHRRGRNHAGPHRQAHSRHSRQHPSRHPTMPEAFGSSPFVHNREQGPIEPIPWMMLRSRYRFHTEDGMNRSVSV